MWSDIVTLGLAILGMIFLLMLITMQITATRTENITISVPLRGCDKTIFRRIYNIRSVLEFCGMKNKCTVVIVNYGASKEFCNIISDFYKNYDFLKIADGNDIKTDLF